MTEKNDYQLLRRHLAGANVRIDRIENLLVEGMPDINICIEGTESWIELKSPKEPKRYNTRLFGSAHRLSREQMNWFHRQKAAGGKCWIFICTNKRLMLVDGAFADHVNHMTVGELIAVAKWHAPRRNKQWKLLKHCLK